MTRCNLANRQKKMDWQMFYEKENAYNMDECTCSGEKH